ncbi:hypothetical protein CEXT_503371 [Caerostris extrusa]|uniref:Uncharacterized protein n=1 Tax=Caerostris extrusa TaxID=172846 RepID=A0AAV4QDP1_CAEEX|nr:hypothetical protein CEXT_503371 [Caerostris extrusa]
MCIISTHISTNGRPENLTVKQVFCFLGEQQANDEESKITPAETFYANETLTIYLEFNVPGQAVTHLPANSKFTCSNYCVSLCEQMFRFNRESYSR